jgi:DNA-binding CsgD family transcriptional regulator
MTSVDDLIGLIYEAGALPELWPSALDMIAAHVGGGGGNLIRSSASGISFQSSPRAAELTAEFDRQGWNRENSRVGRLLAQSQHPGFLTDLDVHTMEEIRSLPMYTEFLTPNGADAGAATVIQGSDHDGLVLAIEMFRNHDTAFAAVPLLNRLRPHMARAAMLSSRIQADRVTTVVDAFNASGLALALLDRNGRALGMSDRFAMHLDGVLLDASNRLRITDPLADERLKDSLARLQAKGVGSSIAIRNADMAGIAVLHLVPARRDARSLFSNIAAFAILARPDNDMLPASDIIAALYDLTPAEARVARGIAEGLSPSALALKLGTSPATVRSQLKMVFAKTSTGRQGELVALLSRFH